MTRRRSLLLASRHQSGAASQDRPLRRSVGPRIADRSPLGSESPAWRASELPADDDVDLTRRPSFANRRRRMPVVTCAVASYTGMTASSASMRRRCTVTATRPTFAADGDVLALPLLDVNGMATKKRSSSRRDTVRSKNATLYAKRTARGRFTEMDAKGRSLKSDRRRTAKKKTRSGYGDQGDRRARRAA